ncbi:MAG: hypothetical protein EOO01_27815 [Chitinophagaceae bacterium]|nr:MAG: hypothetical protein EOO01_27815 [Chitinophagaceae bacterium]
MMARAILFIILFFALKTLPAQQIKGSWYGRADVIAAGAASNYLTEFVLKQKGNCRLSSPFGS